MNEQQQILRLLQIQSKKSFQEGQAQNKFQLFQGIKLKCPSGNAAFAYCLSCSNCSVACTNQDCLGCYRSHLKCERMKKIKQFHSQIQESIVPTFIASEIQQNANFINLSLKEMTNQIQNQLRTFNLTENDKQIVSKIKRYHSNNSKISSEDFVQFQEKKKSMQGKSKWLQNQLTKFENIIKKTKTNILHNFENIEKSIYYEHLENSPNFQNNFFNQSRILNNKVLKNQMLLMLKDLKPIQKIQRVYCGSTDALLNESFHRHCDNKPNLLYVAINEFDKTYGGYSPCPISSKTTNEFEIDQSKTSFIFSLDFHSKSNLVLKQYAIRNSYKPKSKQGVLISFGRKSWPNLIVSENSFAFSKDNLIDMYGGAYQQNGQQVQELTGTSETMCKLKQFQVFQIIFAKEQIQKKSIQRQVQIQIFNEPKVVPKLQPQPQIKKQIKHAPQPAVMQILQKLVKQKLPQKKPAEQPVKAKGKQKIIEKQPIQQPVKAKGRQKVMEVRPIQQPVKAKGRQKIVEEQSIQQPVKKRGRPQTEKKVVIKPNQKKGGRPKKKAPPKKKPVAKKAGKPSKKVKKQILQAQSDQNQSQEDQEDQQQQQEQEQEQDEDQNPNRGNHVLNRLFGNRLGFLLQGQNQSQQEQEQPPRYRFDWKRNCDPFHRRHHW